MPITQWLCNRCGPVPLDHFEKTECGVTEVHPDYANAVLKSRRAHPPGLSVTQLVGCPRAKAIEQAEPYTVDPLSLNAMETGTAWHRHIERGSLDRANTEVQLQGVISGVRIGGRVDRLRPPYIEDWKHQNDGSRKYLGSVKGAHVAQLSLYAELVEQVQGWRPSAGIIWHHWSRADRDRTGISNAMVPKRVNLWSLADTLAFKPNDGAYTVQQLLEQCASGLPWQDLPLVGETMSYGPRDACSYCAVRDICKTEANGAPF